MDQSGETLSPLNSPVVSSLRIGFVDLKGKFVVNTLHVEWSGLEDSSRDWERTLPLLSHSSTPTPRRVISDFQLTKKCWLSKPKEDVR